MCVYLHVVCSGFDFCGGQSTNRSAKSGACRITSDNGGSCSMSTGGSDGSRTLAPDTANGENTPGHCFRQGDYIDTSSWSMTSTRKRRKAGGGNSTTMKRTMNQAMKALRITHAEWHHVVAIALMES